MSELKIKELAEKLEGFPDKEGYVTPEKFIED